LNLLFEILKHQGFVNDPLRGGDEYGYTLYTFNLVKKKITNFF